MPSAACLPPKPLSAVLITVLALSACVLGPTVNPDLSKAVKAHYAQHATEEDGSCRTPQIDTIQSHHVKGRAEDGGEVMAIRYSYFDRHADMDTNWGALFHQSQPCGGIAERDFALTRTHLGYRVKAMSGEQRKTDRSN